MRWGKGVLLPRDATVVVRIYRAGLPSLVPWTQAAQDADVLLKLRGPTDGEQCLAAHLAVELIGWPAALVGAGVVFPVQQVGELQLQAQLGADGPAAAQVDGAITRQGGVIVGIGVTLAEYPPGGADAHIAAAVIQVRAQLAFGAVAEGLTGATVPGIQQAQIHRAAEVAPMLLGAGFKTMDPHLVDVLQR